MKDWTGPLLWVCFASIGIGTFAARFSFIYFFGRIEVPRRVIRVLGFVPPAVLAALIVPSILFQDGAMALTGNDRLLAAAVATAVSWKTRNMLLTICSGMGALWLLQAL